MGLAAPPPTSLISTHSVTDVSSLVALVTLPVKSTQKEGTRQRNLNVIQILNSLHLPNRVLIKLGQTNTSVGCAITLNMGHG